MSGFPQLRPAPISGAVLLTADTAIPDATPYLVLSAVVQLPPSGRGWLVGMSCAAQVSASAIDILNSYPEIDIDGAATVRAGEETFAQGTNRQHSTPGITELVGASGANVAFRLTLTSNSGYLTAIHQVSVDAATLLDYWAVPLD